MGVNLQETFKVHIKAMHWWGIWPAKEYSLIYKIYSFCVYMFVTVPIAILPMLHLLLIKNDNFMAKVQNLFLNIQMCALVFKAYSILTNVEGVKKSFELLNSPWFNRQYPEQDHILLEAQKIARRNSLIFLFFCDGSLFGFSTLPLVTRSGKLPQDVWLPYDTSSFGIAYILTYIYIVIGVAHGAHSHCALDTLSAGLMAIACGELRVLKNTLQNLTKYTELNLEEEHVEKCDVEKRRRELLYRNIRNCIKHHEAIVEFVDNIQSTYSVVMFWQFVAASLVICMSMILLTMVEPNTFQFYFMINFLLTMLTEIYLYTYYGTELYHESTSITESIYLGDWYNYDPASKKALIILMERTKKPMLLMGGYVLDITVDTFTMILRRAYSLFAVLRNYK